MTAPDNTAEQPPALELHHVSFHYGRVADGKSLTGHPLVLDKVELAVREGEVLGVIGPNGSGKSSLLKVLARLIHPQEGTVHLSGEDLGRVPREVIARRIAYMPQDVTVDFPFSVTELVLMGRYPHRRRTFWSMAGWEKQEDLDVAEGAMVMTDVAHLADRQVGTLSAGERQRVLLARALAQQPRVLLLDEPTAHLDLNHQLDVCRILSQIHERLGMTVVLVSHDINLAVHQCQRMMVMKRGAVVSIGTPTQVVQARLLADVYGCDVLVDRHPESGLPRVSLPSCRSLSTTAMGAPNIC